VHDRCQQVNASEGFQANRRLPVAFIGNRLHKRKPQRVGDPNALHTLGGRDVTRTLHHSIDNDAPVLIPALGHRFRRRLEPSDDGHARRRLSRRGSMKATRAGNGSFIAMVEQGDNRGDD